MNKFVPYAKIAITFLSFYISIYESSMLGFIITAVSASFCVRSLMISGLNPESSKNVN